MGGTVLDMFTLGATPFSLSLYSFPTGRQGEGAIQSSPLRLTYLRLFHLPVSLLSSLFKLSCFLFFLSFFLSFFPLFPRV